MLDQDNGQINRELRDLLDGKSRKIIFKMIKKETEKLVNIKKLNRVPNVHFICTNFCGNVFQKLKRNQIFRLSLCNPAQKQN